MELEDFSVNLHDLPFEVLEMIFKYLDAEDLRILLELAGRLREVIISSPISMRKLQLTLRSEDWIKNVDFIRSYGDCVKILNFERCNLDYPSQFRDMIKFMKNIEFLRLSNIHVDVENFNKRYKRCDINFDRISKIDFDNSKAVGKLVRLYLHNIQVEEMRLEFSNFNVTDEFLRLVWSQLNLSTLELSGFENIIYSSFFRDGIDISYMIRFELKKLIINHRVIKHDLYLKFIECLHTLEFLEVHKEVECQDFFNIVFELPRLRSLTLATNFVTLKNIDFKKINSNIEELVFITRNQYGIEQTINYFVEKLVKLRSLKVVNLKTDSSDQLLACTHLKNVEKFHVENSKLKFMQTIKFDNLRRVKLTNIHPFLKFEDWENFFKNNSCIEELIISEFEVYCVIEQIVLQMDKIITNLPHILKSLKLLEISQELRYHKPIKVVVKRTTKQKTLHVSDSFIKFCRDNFHFLRKLDSFKLSYYADDFLRINNKYI